MFYRILSCGFHFWAISCCTTERIPLTSIERSIDIPIQDLDKKIVNFLNEPPPNKDKNVQAVANMNVLLFRYVMDYFNYLNGIGDLLLNEDNAKHAYRILEEIGLEGPQLLKVDMDRKSWNAISKMYGYHEGEIDEMVTTLGAIKVMWDSLKISLEAHLNVYSFPLDSGIIDINLKELDLRVSNILQSPEHHSNQGMQLYKDVSEYYHYLSKMAADIDQNNNHKLLHIVLSQPPEFINHHFDDDSLRKAFSWTEEELDEFNSVFEGSYLLWQRLQSMVNTTN